VPWCVALTLYRGCYREWPLLHIRRKLLVLRLLGAECLCDMDESNWPAARDEYMAILESDSQCGDALLVGFRNKNSG
jgi:hypothetical protein